MKRPSISLAMIVKNEAHNLPRLFESIQGCFDEVHITDTGSTDGTVELAKSLGAHVHHFDWIMDFAAARNASFTPITTDYVMWLDGDDVLENREQFIHFRDHVMNLGDYWIAPYHYTSDHNDKPVCTFARERIFKVSMGMKWKYAIHEGVIAHSDKGAVKVQAVQSWAVKHRRTAEDLQNDRSRNITIFQDILKKGPLDARMRYYYGKELFEAQRLEECIMVLGAAITDPKIEMHDRILGYQYLCFAYCQTNQFEKALSLAQQGQLLSPHRAEFYTLMGDCFLKLNRIVDAIPSFQAAKSCIHPDYANQPVAIFHHEDAYTAYPRNQLARIYANIGQLDKARIEARESAEIYHSAEGKVILDEINRITVITKSFDQAKQCQDIVISTPPMNAYEFDADIYKQKAMGGSETALIEMAHWLHKLSGRKVKVFNMRSEDKICDGVEYISNTKIHDYMSESKPYLHIAWRHSIKLTNAPTFIWCHDLQTPGIEASQFYDKIMCLTPFHQNYAICTQRVPADKIYLTRNGLNPDKFSGLGAFAKDPWRFVIGSSPDRGLDRAMLVLDRVRKKYPLIKLHIHYGWEHLDRYGLADLRIKLEAMYAERKDWIVYHGATEQRALMESYARSAYCIQPSDWIETSKITALEMACAGVYQITRAVGGCIDTLAPITEKKMATLVESDCLTESDYDLYAQKVIEAIEAEAYKNVFVDADQYSWKAVAEQWLQDLPRLAGYAEEHEYAVG